jgi:RES domain-containing protein
MKAYRLCSPWHKPWDATGARRRGGRWNSPGIPVLYAASSISLACLEILVHVVDTTIVPEFAYSEIDVPDALVTPWEENELPTEAILASTVLSREFGDFWMKRAIKTGGTDPADVARFRRDLGDLPVQQVPSAVVAPEWNYLINPEHDDFRELTWSEPRVFRIDRRLIDPALR